MDRKHYPPGNASIPVTDGTNQRYITEHELLSQRYRPLPGSMRWPLDESISFHSPSGLITPIVPSCTSSVCGWATTTTNTITSRCQNFARFLMKNDFDHDHCRFFDSGNHE